MNLKQSFKNNEIIFISIIFRFDNFDNKNNKKSLFQ